MPPPTHLDAVLAVELPFPVHFVIREDPRKPLPVGKHEFPFALLIIVLEVTLVLHPVVSDVVEGPVLEALL